MAGPVVSPVVITRPLAQADGLAHQVRAAGRIAHIFPLLEISPLEDGSALQSELASLTDYALVAFVSPNAIDAAFRILRHWPDGVPLAVMGEGSRKALAAHGITDANATIISPLDTGRTDSQTLLEALDLSSLRGRKVLVIRGQNGRELLADALRDAGAAVTQVAAYRREAPKLDDARRAELVRLIEQDAVWIVTSSEALRNLLDMTEKTGGAAFVAKLQQRRFLVPHRRIAETAQLLGLSNVTLTGSGDESLIAALQSRA